MSWALQHRDASRTGGEKSNGDFAGSRSRDRASAVILLGRKRQRETEEQRGLFLLRMMIGCSLGKMRQGRTCYPRRRMGCRRTCKGMETSGSDSTTTSKTDNRGSGEMDTGSTGGGRTGNAGGSIISNTAVVTIISSY